MQSERIDVKSMSVQQRSNYTYGKVRSLYENKVAEAEGLRQKTADTPINTLLSKFASVRTQQNLEEGLRRRESLGADVSLATQTIDLGMAGLFRIGHVHENSMTNRDRDHSEQHIEKALNWYYRHEFPISVKRTTDVINETIHGDAIYWQGETLQDLVRTHYSQGDEEWLPVYSIENRMLYELTALKEDGGWNLEGEKKKKVTGLLNSLGMIQIQRARHNKDLSLFYWGFRQVKSAEEIESNPHRMATISMWLFANSINPEYSAYSLGRRFDFAKTGLKEYLKVLFSKNYKSALSSTRQALRRNI